MTKRGTIASGVGAGVGAGEGVALTEDPVELSDETVTDAVVLDCTSLLPPHEASMKAMASTLAERIWGVALRALDMRQVMTQLPYGGVSANGK
jgi:hypothetical protein